MPSDDARARFVEFVEAKGKLPTASYSFTPFDRFMDAARALADVAPQILAALDDLDGHALSAENWQLAWERAYEGAIRFQGEIRHLTAQLERMKEPAAPPVSGGHDEVRERVATIRRALWPDVPSVHWLCDQLTDALDREARPGPGLSAEDEKLVSYVAKRHVIESHQGSVEDCAWLPCPLIMLVRRLATEGRE